MTNDEKYILEIIKQKEVEQVWFPCFKEEEENSNELLKKIEEMFQNIVG